MTPYIVDGFGGAFLGLLIALMVGLLLRMIRRPWASRRPRRPQTPPRGRATASAGNCEHLPSASVQPPTPPLTKPELHELRLKIRESVVASMRELNGGGDRHDILARALSIGGFTTRELEAPASSRSRKKHSRQIDHDLDWALTELKRDGLATNPARGTWSLIEAALVEPVPLVAGEPAEQRLAELRAMPHDDYLRTPEWRRTRAAALLRSGHRCALDSKHPGPLEVHHNSYERRGAELPTDLIVLCRACHQRHHKHPGR